MLLQGRSVTKAFAKVTKMKITLDLNRWQADALVSAVTDWKRDLEWVMEEGDTSKQRNEAARLLMHLYNAEKELKAAIRRAKRRR
jgi:hypothetical protein